MIHAIQPTLDDAIQCWGDSLTQNSSGGIEPYYRWPSKLGYMFSPPRAVLNAGAGGETTAQILARHSAGIVPNPTINLIWTGRNGVLVGGQTPTVICDVIQSIVDEVSDDRYLVLTVANILDGTEDAGDANGDKVIALNAEIAIRWPNNYLDVYALLQDTSSRNAPSDYLHLSATGAAIVANAVYARIVSEGW